MILRATKDGNKSKKRLSMSLTLSFYLNPHEVNSYAVGAMSVCT